MASSLCGNSIGSRRALLAALWSLVTILTFIAFLTALTFTLSARNLYKNDEYNNYYNNNEKEGEEEMDPEVAVTSRAMAFAALWTAVLASLLTVFGTVVLGWQSPTGQYYTCCSSNVHRTTPLSLGSFIGALIMFANLTLVCSVLFGEFEVRQTHLQATVAIWLHTLFCISQLTRCPHSSVDSRLSTRSQSRRRRKRLEPQLGKGHRHGTILHGILHHVHVLDGLICRVCCIDVLIFTQHH
jgi:hypothetical protein